MMVWLSAGSMDLLIFFVTFPCDINWPEISLGILEAGQKPSDKADIVVRVYNMKLEEMLDDIKSGNAFGHILAGNSWPTTAPFFVRGPILFPNIY